MSASVTSQEARQPATPFAGVISAAMIAIALAAVITIAVAAYVLRDTGPAVSFDATNALQTHVLRENGGALPVAAPDTGPARYDHLLRENSAN
jgi:hypothetical protein